MTSATKAPLRLAIARHLHKCASGASAVEITAAVGRAEYPSVVIKELNAMRTDCLLEWTQGSKKKPAAYWLAVPLEQIEATAATAETAAADAFDLPDSIKIGTRSAQVWRALRNGERLTARELASAVGCATGALDPLLAALIKDGTLARNKRGNVYQYFRPRNAAPQPAVGENTGSSASATASMTSPAEGAAVHQPAAVAEAPPPAPAAADDTGNAGPQDADAETAADAVATGIAQSAATGDADIDIWNTPELRYLADEDYALPDADPALLALANRMLSDRLERVAFVLRGCGLPALENVQRGDDLQMAAAALAAAHLIQSADLRGAQTALKLLHADIERAAAEIEATHDALAAALDGPIDPAEFDLADLARQVGAQAASLRGALANEKALVEKLEHLLQSARNEAQHLRQHAAAADIDMVNHPPHYQGKVECIDAIEAALGPEGFAAYCRGNTLKYTFRAGKKGPAEQDLAKAGWYLARIPAPSDSPTPVA